MIIMIETSTVDCYHFARSWWLVTLESHVK